MDGGFGGHSHGGGMPAGFNMEDLFGHGGGFGGGGFGGGGFGGGGRGGGYSQYGF